MGIHVDEKRVPLFPPGIPLLRIPWSEFHEAGGELVRTDEGPLDVFNWGWGPAHLDQGAIEKVFASTAVYVELVCAVSGGMPGDSVGLQVRTLLPGKMPEEMRRQCIGEEDWTRYVHLEIGEGVPVGLPPWLVPPVKRSLVSSHVWLPGGKERKELYTDEQQCRILQFKVTGWRPMRDAEVELWAWIIGSQD